MAFLGFLIVCNAFTEAKSKLTGADKVAKRALKAARAVTAGGSFQESGSSSRKFEKVKAIWFRRREQV
jgi:hypothetical protein